MSAAPALRSLSTNASTQPQRQRQATADVVVELPRGRPRALAGPGVPSRWASSASRSADSASALVVNLGRLWHTAPRPGSCPRAASPSSRSRPVASQPRNCATIVPSSATKLCDRPGGAERLAQSAEATSAYDARAVLRWRRPGGREAQNRGSASARAFGANRSSPAVVYSDEQLLEDRPRHRRHGRRARSPRRSDRWPYFAQRQQASLGSERLAEPLEGETITTRNGLVLLGRRGSPPGTRPGRRRRLGDERLLPEVLRRRKLLVVDGLEEVGAGEVEAHAFVVWHDRGSSTSWVLTLKRCRPSLMTFSPVFVEVELVAQ